MKNAYFVKSDILGWFASFVFAVIIAKTMGVF